MLERFVAWVKKPWGAKLPVQPYPIEINPASIRGERNMLRLARLELALEAETDEKRKQALTHEIGRRRQFGR